MRTPFPMLYLASAAAVAFIALCVGCDQTSATPAAPKSTPAASQPAPGAPQPSEQSKAPVPSSTQAPPTKLPDAAASPATPSSQGKAAGTAAPANKLVTAIKGDPAKGKRIWAAFGCATCHAIEGKNPQGPTMKGYWMTARKLSDGREVIADVEYTRRAILEPTAEIVPGYPIPMTSFKGMLDDDQVNDLIAYLKSLSN